MLKRIRDWWTRPSWEVYLDDHQAFIDMSERAEKADAECSALTTKLFFADQEAERLRGLMMDEAKNSPVRDIRIEDGAIEVITEPPHWAVK